MATRMCLVVAVLSLAGLTVHAQNKSSIQGVWRIAEVTTTGPNAATNKAPRPGVYIFTARHYSMVRDTTTGTTTRPAIKDVANVTAAEALATFNPFMAQTGTYEVKGDTLSVIPIVAKVPPATGKYVATTYSFKIQGDTLILTQGTNAAGAKVPNPSTFRLTRIE